MSSPVNMMERNFVSADRGESNYLKTMRAVAQARKSLSITRQNSILEAGRAACAAARSMAERILEAKKAGRNMMFEGQTATAEASKRNLDEIKDHIEEKAKEALEALGDEQEAATTTEEETSGQKTQDSQQASTQTSQGKDSVATAPTPPASQDTEGSGTTATPAAPPAAAAPVAVLPTPTVTPSIGMKIDIVV
ncbi:hypothetical protein QUW15_12010 [Desulfovibrio piger]|nr:hypothetical protein [Desulfovibrio piger]